VHLNITEACNQKCLHCGAVTGTGRGEELKRDEIFYLIDRLVQLGVDSLAITSNGDLYPCPLLTDERLETADYQFPPVMKRINNSQIALELLKRFRGGVSSASLQGELKTNTGLGYTWDHNFLGQELFEKIFTEHDYVIGSIVTSAKIESYTQHGTTSDLVQTFTLFGDPATILRVE
jgi:hypothetical protein